MNYEDYISMGFERIDRENQYYFQATGHKYFDLLKKLDENTHLYVHAEDLNKVYLSVRLFGQETFTTIRLDDWGFDQIMKDFTYAQEKKK